MTSRQHEPSAHAPWTRTTLGRAFISHLLSADRVTGRRKRRIPPQSSTNRPESYHTTQASFKSASLARNPDEGGLAVPMIDVYATAGTFAYPHQLAHDLATTLMKIEQAPDIPMFRQNTPAFIHELPDANISNVEG